MIKAIIFDWAGVIGADGYWVWLYENVLGSKENRSPFQELSEQVDSARISHKEFMDRLVQVSGKPADKIWQEVKATIVINTELVVFIKEIKKKYKVALLSNFTHTWLREILTDNALWVLFDHHIISSEHKMIKPNPDIFHKMLSMLEVEPSEAIFVDDRQYNIDASNALGIKALLYKDFKTFKKDLAQNNVIV